MPGDHLKLEAKSIDTRESFLFDVNRRGRLRLSKCTYQERYAVVEVLIRLDVDGPPHVNPDGNDVPCPHIHVYRESFGDKWAEPMPSDFTDTTDLAKTLEEFLTYCHVVEFPEIQRSLI